MAAVTIHHDLEPPKMKSDTVSTVSPTISHEVMGPDAMILIFWMLSYVKECKGCEGGKVNSVVSDLEVGSDHNWQGTHSCLVDEDVVITCERRGKQQRSNMVGGLSD